MPGYGYLWWPWPRTQGLLYLVLSKYLFLPSSWAHSSGKTFFWSWILKTLSKFREKKKKVIVLCFPSTKRKIVHFHVVVIQWWQRNVQKSEMHVQSCCETYCSFLTFSHLNFSLMTKPNIVKCNPHKSQAVLPCLPSWKSCNNLCMGCSEAAVRVSTYCT